MQTLIWIKRIRVENANCIHGLTWGFPAMTNFLGFTHALSRDLNAKFDFGLDGCGVIAHDTQVQAHRNNKFKYTFAQSRNPLVQNKKKKDEFVSAPINQEGRMHMTVSLLLSSEQLTEELELSDSIAEDEKTLKQAVVRFLQRGRIAGGSVPSVDDHQVEVVCLGVGEARQSEERRIRMGLLPGFALVDRSELLSERHSEMQADNPEADLLDAWLSFAELRYDYVEQSDDEKGRWQVVPKQGYLVPICRGFKAIGPLLEAGTVASSRDPQTPFRLVESAYGVGQWLSPHRSQSLDKLIWCYQYQDEWYLVENSAQPQNLNNTTQSI